MLKFFASDVVASKGYQNAPPSNFLTRAILCVSV